MATPDEHTATLQQYAQQVFNRITATYNEVSAQDRHLAFGELAALENAVDEDSKFILRWIDRLFVLQEQDEFARELYGESLPF